MDFGRNTNSLSTPTLTSFKFRTFSNPTLPSSVRNIWQSSIVNGNVMMGRQDISAVNADQFYLSVFDGTPITGPFDFLALDRAAIYASSNTLDEAGMQINSYAAVAGDLRYGTNSAEFTKYAILGLAGFGTPKNNWAGYFVGNVGTTGTFVEISDKNLKQTLKMKARLPRS